MHRIFKIEFLIWQIVPKTIISQIVTICHIIYHFSGTLCRIVLRKFYCVQRERANNVTLLLELNHCFWVAAVSVVRVDCIPVHKRVKSHICEELLPSETVINLYNLCEHTEYDIVITAITDEFFDSLSDGHEWKMEQQIPQNNVEIPDSEWLPKSTITVSTGW